MHFRSRIVRLSQLIADRIVGAQIIASTLTDATLTDPTQTGGDQTGGTITGAVHRTNESGARTEMVDAGVGLAGLRDVRFYTGMSTEDDYGYVGATGFGPVGGRILQTEVHSPALAGVSDPVGFDHASIDLETTDEPGTEPTTIRLNASYVAMVFGSLLDLDSIKLAFGRSLGGLDFGNNTGNTNASSDRVIAHSLGVTPTIVLVSAGTAHQLHVLSWDASNITVRVRTPAGVTVGSGVSAQILWAALRAGV